MKKDRQAELIQIICEQNVETQEQLQELLKTRGIQVTQATISRDVKDLHLIKEQAEDGSYRYAVPADQREIHNQEGKLRNIFREGVIHFDVAQNIVVIKTMPGLASAAGAALDGMKINGFLGSLAGDDTVAMIMRTNQDAETFLEEIKVLLR